MLLPKVSGFRDRLQAGGFRIQDSGTSGGHGSRRMSAQTRPAVAHDGQLVVHTVRQHRVKKCSLRGYSNMPLVGNTKTSEGSLPLLAVGKGSIAHRGKLGKRLLRQFLRNHVLEGLTTYT